VVAPKLIVTVLPLPGANVYVAEETIVANVLPLGLPCTDSVWLRWLQPAGSLSCTWSMLWLLPRSTCAHWGKAPEPCQ
jgi:hypothetical protein